MSADHSEENGEHLSEDTNCASLDETVPKSDRGKLLKAQLDDLRLQISKRRDRQTELEKLVQLYPPRDTVEKESQQVEDELQRTRDSLESVNAELDSLRPSEDRAYNLCARLSRLEKYADQAEQWASTTFSAQVEGDIAKEAEEADSQVAAFIESLQVRRQDVLDRMEALRSRIRDRAAELRRGHHPQPRTMQTGAFSIAATPQAEGMERCTSPRLAEEDILLDDETSELLLCNEALGGELHDLVDRLRRLQKLRSKFQSEFMKAKVDSRKELTLLENLIRQTEQRFARDQRMIQQLHSSNAALTSTLQLVMGQLNVEHYGTQIGPASIEAQKNQTALLTARSARGNSPSKPRLGSPHK